MANDFSSDSTCISVYNFESGALTTDSKGLNTLNDVNTVAEDAVNYKQGSCAADFELSNSECFYIDDSSLSSGFPLKDGTSNTIGSFTFWFKIESMPSMFNYSAMLAKYSNSYNYKSFAISLFKGSTNNLVLIAGTGNSSETNSVYTTLVTDNWYWIGVSIDYTTNRFYYRLWDDVASAWVAVGWWCPSVTPGLYQGKFTIGAYANAASTYISYYDGLLDEVTIWNSFLSYTDMAAIKSGTYSGTGSHVTTSSSMTWKIDPSFSADNSKQFNSGTSWNDAFWGLSEATNAARPSDTILVKKSAVTSLGSCTWADDSYTITLPSSTLTKNIDTCESSWTQSANVTCSTNTSYHMEGSKSASIVIATAFTTGLAAYHAMSSTDFSDYDRISFWLLNSSSYAVAANSIRIDLCSDNAGTTPVNSFTINKAIVNNGAYFITLLPDGGGSLGDAIQSIAITVLIDLSTSSNITLYIDNIIACTSTLHLSGLIGRNDGKWFAPIAINGDTVTVGRGGSSHNYWRHNGTGDSATSYFMEAYPIYTTTGPLLTHGATAVSGTFANPILLKGGINTVDDSQDGYTIFIAEPVGSHSLRCVGIDYYNVSNMGFRGMNYIFTTTAVSIGWKFHNIIANGITGELFCATSAGINELEFTGDWYITNCNGYFMSIVAPYPMDNVYCTANITFSGECGNILFSIVLNGAKFLGKITIDESVYMSSAVASIGLNYCVDCYFDEIEIASTLVKGIYTYGGGNNRIGKLTIGSTSTYTVSTDYGGLLVIDNLNLTGSLTHTVAASGLQYISPALGLVVEHYNADDRWLISKYGGTISDHITGGQVAGWAYGGSGLSMLFNPTSTEYPLSYSFKVPVVASTAYELHMQVIKTSSGANCTLTVSVFGAGITKINKESVTLTDSWAEYQSTSFTPTYNGYVLVELEAFDGATTGDIGVDDIHLAEV